MSDDPMVVPGSDADQAWQRLKESLGDTDDVNRGFIVGYMEGYDLAAKRVYRVGYEAGRDAPKGNQ